MLKGFVNIDKPLNMTSSDVVVIVRGILRRATGEKQKVGHFGTLDPMASGVLPVAIGGATRLFDYAQAKTKVYQATFKFGIETDTLDRAGQIIKKSSYIPAEHEIVNEISKYNGETLQIPPLFSAKSIDGRRAYDLARAGVDFELQPKKVCINSVKLIKSENGYVNLENGIKKLDEDEFAFEITCGGGTYIRAIARDIAQSLGTVAYMSSLNRVQSGNFMLKDAISIDEFEQNPLSHINDLWLVLNDFDKFELPKDDADKILNGIKFHYPNLPAGNFVATLDGTPVAMAHAENGFLHLQTRI